ncbi:hypothetical protein CGK11_24295 [Vibrio parahaemolyticus]|uniref:hypothetical protein n=1 Tax=Vibrio alginolyticus TaxID=663 RepID=UPI00111E0B15|nr:hypothetical protein [Vibrio alginolyticus]MBS9938681.1 hypothetical protein [Vibrio alginolyticus]TOB16577.1 hypothetical protein CGK11_24295 [Vibrio parahaemolyticus]
MDNEKLWLLTAQSVVKFCRISTDSTDSTDSLDTKGKNARKMKVRQASTRASRNIKVVVSS